MITKVTHNGSARTWKGPLENWNAHSEVIIGWCDGAEVEWSNDLNEWTKWSDSRPKCNIFELYWGIKYRLAKREPKPGEVWKLGKITLHITEGKLAVDQSGGLYDLGKYELDQMKYITPDLRTYYAREFLAENDLILSGSETSVESYAGSLVSVMEKYAQLENEK